MIARILEPELMDTAVDANQYDAMDHSAVNAQFITDLLNAMSGWSLQRPVSSDAADGELKILDLGTGTAQIPIELARRAPAIRITAVDAAEQMLALARRNVAAAGLADRIELVVADAKRLTAIHSAARFHAASYPVVISNSIVHHVAEPREVIAESVRVAAPGGLLFHRDLARPHDDAQLKRLVAVYAADATAYQRKLFADSLRAALTLEECQQLVGGFGFRADTVRMTSDRHWTWTAST